MCAAAAAAADVNTGASFLWLTTQLGSLEPLQGDNITRMLRLAVFGGCVEVVRYLVTQTADPNAEGSWKDFDDAAGCSCLMMAAGEGAIEIVEVLLEAGARVNDLSAVSAETALMRAMLSVDPMAVCVSLLDARAEVDIRDVEGRCALEMAARRGLEQEALLLLQHGADVNGQDQRGETALMRAVETGQEESVKLLLRWRADPRIKNKHDCNAVQIAQRERAPDILRLLLGQEYMEVCSRLERDELFGHSATLRRSKEARGEDPEDPVSPLRRASSFGAQQSEEEQRQLSELPFELRRARSL